MGHAAIRLLTAGLVLAIAIRPAAAMSTPPDPVPPQDSENRHVRWARVFSEPNPEGADENGWDLLVFTVARTCGMLDGFASGSPVAQAYFAGSTGEDDPRGPSDIVQAVLGNLEPPDAPLAAEGRRFLKSLDHWSLPYELDELAAVRRFVPASMADGAGADPVWSVREAGRILQARARVAIEENDAAAFRLWIVRGLAVARGSSHGNAFRLSLGSTVSLSLFGEVRDAVRAGRVDAETAEILLVDLQDHRLAPAAMVIRAERLWIDGILRPLYQESDLAFPGWRQRNEDVINRFFDAWERWCTREGEEGDLAWADIQRVHAEIEAEENKFLLRPAFTVLPAPSTVRRAVLRHAVGRAGVQVMLAAEVYKGKHGQYPDAADALAPGILKELPRDPFSPERAPMRYKRLDPAADPLGRAYLVYSVGADGADDGGVEHSRGNHEAAFTGARAAGTDYIINTTSW